MMRTVLSLVPLAALAACSPVGGATAQTSRDFVAAGFNAVRVAGSDTVNVVRGPVASVVARGPAALLDKLVIRTEGATLVVARKSAFGMGWSSGNVVVTVTMPAIRAVDVAGSSDVSVDRADGVEFDASVSGSGNLDLADIATASTKLRVAGSGNITARGKTQTLSADVSGSGGLAAEKLIADTVSIAVMGSGDARAFARNSATLSVTGSGNANVAGTKQCAITTKGSGEARCTG